MTGSAEISACGRYRYLLRRQWGASNRHAVFVMLNPSTADALTDDATVRKCVGFAQRWGMDGLAIVNLFAFRSRSPGDLATAVDPVGPENDRWIAEATCSPFASVFAAWGAHGEPYSGRVRQVCTVISRAMRCISTTKAGHPSHPLMLSYRLMPMPWEFDLARK